MHLSSSWIFAVKVVSNPGEIERLRALQAFKLTLSGWTRVNRKYYSSHMEQNYQVIDDYGTQLGGHEPTEETVEAGPMPETFYKI